MFARLLTASVACAVLLTGCTTRWQPETHGPVKLTEACPLRRAPVVHDFGTAGLRGVYHFVTDNASDRDILRLIDQTEEQGFALILHTLTINGRDTVFAQGPGVLHNQSAVDSEFRSACRLGGGGIYLTHVRYNVAEADQRSTRVR